MGLILKIVIFAVAAYGIWTTASRWFNLLGGNRRPPPANRPQAPRENTRETAQARPRVIEDTHPCSVCGAYVSAGAAKCAAKCARPDCPQS